MENKLYITTYWQSLDLLQAKIDRSTSDYVYVRYDGVPHPRKRDPKDEFNSDLIPAWSVGRLWDLMGELGLSYEFSTAYDSADVVINSIVEALKTRMR